MTIKVSTQVLNLPQIPRGEISQPVAYEYEAHSPPHSPVTVAPLAQEVQQVESYSYNHMAVAVATAGDVELPSGGLLARFDVDGDGSWSDEEYLASQLMLKMKNDCFEGDFTAMSTWLSDHGFSSPMSLDDASAALEMYLAESTS
jgi:hypothetical protein